MHVSNLFEEPNRYYSQAYLGSLERNLMRVLGSARGERGVHEFLKENPLVVAATFAGCWSTSCCVSEFQFGSDLRCDFLIRSGASDLAEIRIIEMKSHRARLYLKDGTPSKDLRLAQRQIFDTKVWVERHRSYFRESLRRACRTKLRCPDISDGDHNCWIHDLYGTRLEYFVLIGRRGELSDQDNSRRSEQGEHGDFRIATYDRLLDMCRLLARGARPLRYPHLRPRRMPAKGSVFHVLSAMIHAECVTSSGKESTGRAKMRGKSQTR
jgi:hypothetical protein